MKGENEFRLNEATMMMIVQQWIDRTMSGSEQTVTGVMLVSDSPAEFQITIQASQEE